MYDRIIPNYSLITSRFGSLGSIEAATSEQILEAMEVCHAFRDQQRFYPGGLETLRKEFLAIPLDRMRRALRHLLHSEEHYITRMAALIFEPDLKLRSCSTSVVQELLGWVNTQNIPICNQRTLKVLRFLGHDLLQVN